MRSCGLHSWRGAVRSSSSRHRSNASRTRRAIPTCCAWARCVTRVHHSMVASSPSPHRSGRCSSATVAPCASSRPLRNATAPPIAIRCVTAARDARPDARASSAARTCVMWPDARISLHSDAWQIVPRNNRRAPRVSRHCVTARREVGSVMSAVPTSRRRAPTCRRDRVPWIDFRRRLRRWTVARRPGDLSVRVGARTMPT